MSSSTPLHDLSKTNAHERYAKDLSLLTKTEKETFAQGKTLPTPDVLKTKEQESALSQLFNISKRKTFFEAPKGFNTIRKLLFTSGLFPSISLSNVRTLLEKTKTRQKKPNQEKQALENFVILAEEQKEIIDQIIAERNQYQKG